MTPEEYRALAHFRWRLRRFLSISETIAREHGIEPQQHQVLLALKGLDPGEEPSIRAIAVRMCVRHHTAVELVDRLEAHKLVRRRQSDTDRRSMLVEPTRRGEALLRKLSLAHRDELRTEAPKLVETLQLICTPQKNSKKRARGVKSPLRRG